VEAYLAKLLDFLPDTGDTIFEWFGTAARITQTGPNEISFRAPVHMALVMFTPQPTREIALNSGRKTIGSAPVGALEIVPAGAELFARWGVAKQNLLVAFDDRQLTELALLEFDKEEVEFRPPPLGAADKKAFTLATQIREEFERGLALNALCLDSLIMLLAAHLLRNHSSCADQLTHTVLGGLPARALRSVTEYIEENISQDLSIGRLAEVVGISPSHFLRAFRQTSGQAPHQYVLGRRLALVERLATASDMPLASVAKAAGFSNPSHMTATLKRLRGVTPTELRREKQKSAR
jgi:AraC family transcriptional regulator